MGSSIKRVCKKIMVNPRYRPTIANSRKPVKQQEEVKEQMIVMVVE